MDTFRLKVTALRQALQSGPLLRTRQRLRFAAILGCGLWSVLLAWFGTQYQGTPEAILPIEHANVLAAETFAAGRLVNPAHPAGFFLQTYLTLQTPAYGAAVPPGPGLWLALGVLFGDPLYGVRLAVGLYGALTVWMLLGFTSLRWALIGGLLSAIWLGMLSFWAQSFAPSLYIGLGVALAWGAARRYVASGRSRDISLLGIGLAWSWLCHPAAAVFAAIIPLVLAARGWRRQPRHLVYFAAGPVLALGFQALLAYAATGSPAFTAQELYRQTYQVHPQFVWELPRIPPRYDFWRMEQYDVFVQEAASRFSSPVGKIWLGRLQELVLFYLGLPGVLLVAAAGLVGLSRWALYVLAAGLVSAATLVLVPPFGMSFTAPIAPLALILIVWALRRIWSLRAHAGRDCWRLLGIVAAAFVLAAFHRGLGFTRPAQATTHQVHKNSLIEFLTNTPGDDLVLVKYIAATDIQVEYVYNHAEVDRQPIVWARWHEKADLSPLLSHFQNRTVWSLTILPEGEPELRPFVAGEKS